MEVESTPSGREDRVAPRRASITLLEAAPDFENGRRTRLRLRVANTGSRRWGRFLNPPCVSYRWLWPNGETLVADGRRTKLRRSLAPGDACDLVVKVVAPNTTGDWILELDLVVGADGWFRKHGSPPLRIEASVVRGAMGDFGEYADAWERADLENDYWSIVGPASRDEFDALGLVKRESLIRHGLTPRSRVLDVGCGTGCLTRALVDYLGDDARYVGTDIAPQAITFCRKRYARPNFDFAVNGQTEAGVEGEHFDIVTLSSVFTHMYPAEIAEMSISLAGLLAPEGVILADAFTTEEGPEFSGNRAKVDIRAATLDAVFASAGLDVEGTEVLACEGDVTRSLYRLSRRAGELSD